ncbi:MAG: DUF2200 domain-containing protein [Actinomycetales bacterium]|nr:DUF2200 domain-containing protein [Actinomycetales bacterium]
MPSRTPTATSRASRSTSPSRRGPTRRATTTWTRAPRYPDRVHRIFATPVADVYPLYVAKLERKGRTRAELDEVVEWLTGFDDARLAAHLAERTDFAGFFADADLNPRVEKITGVICGVRVEEIEDPLMQKIRYLDKLVDELAKGKPMEKVLRA